MNILCEDFLKIFSPWCSLTLMGEDMLERVLEDPAQPLMKEVNQGFGIEQIATYDTKTSFVDLCRRGKANGARRMDVHYDFFFGGNQRSNYPDSPITVQAYKVIYDILQQYGISMGASVVSPLDTGGGYVKTHSQTGQSMQFREGVIQADGTYKIRMDYQTLWTNNKGPAPVTFKELKVFAFDEERIEGTPFYYVDENEILDISDTGTYYVDPNSLQVCKEGYGYGDIHISGKTDCGKTRFLAVVIYKTLEIDYFAEDALPYMKSILDLHKAAGISYEGIYSDEMHIQFDWESQHHFAETEVTSRYMTDSMARVFAEKYGRQYRDFTKYLVYFTYMHQEVPGEEEQQAQHVLGKNREGILRTYMLRKNYCELLHRQVVDLCCQAKAYAEEIFGCKMQATGHSTWQESPTMDIFYRCGAEVDPKIPHSRYEYTPNYIWSGAQRENISACNDHFKWNEYFWAVGTDIPEGGFMDRNYYGAAYTSGLAALNPAAVAYYCIWGNPDAVKERMVEVGQTYGHYAGYCKSYDIGHNILQGCTTRISDVLAVCPMDLNHLEERYGNWMVQYGYADYVTEEKLLQHTAKPDGPVLCVKDRKYRALVVFFSPLMSMETLALIQQYIEQGGTVVWCSAPALREDNGEAQLFRRMFGIASYDFGSRGISAQGEEVCFRGFSTVANMKILCSTLPDHVYPVAAAEALPVAMLGNRVVGTVKEYPSGGKAVYLGFRVRDDQSCSLGSDVDTLFSVLRELGCYEENGPEASSRPTDARYIYNRFPNGAVCLANHFRSIREQGWNLGFYRDEEADNAFMKNVSLPPHEICLEDWELEGHRIRYHGDGIVTYRYDAQEGLLALGGRNTCGIAIDGKEYRICDTPADIMWGKIDRSLLDGAVESAYLFKVNREGCYTLPFDGSGMQLSKCKNYVLETKGECPFTHKDGAVQVRVSAEDAGCWFVFHK